MLVRGRGGGGELGSATEPVLDGESKSDSSDPATEGDDAHVGLSSLGEIRNDPQLEQLHESTCAAQSPTPAFCSPDT